MANKIQFRRGLKSKLPLLSVGEPGYTTDSHELFVGATGGNVNMGGSHWYVGTEMSASSGAANYYSASPMVKRGDMFLNTSNGNIYECTTAGFGIAAKWAYRGCLKGAAGTTTIAYIPTITKLSGYYEKNEYHVGNVVLDGVCFIPEDTREDSDDNYYDRIRVSPTEYYTTYSSDGTSTRSMATHNAYFVKFVEGKCIILAEGYGTTPEEIMLKNILK